MGKWVSEQASKDAESRQVVEGVDEKELSLSDESLKDFVDTQLLDKAEGVATQVRMPIMVSCYIAMLTSNLKVISTRDDPELSVLTFRVLFLGVGLSAFSAVGHRKNNCRISLTCFIQVLSTIYTFKPQNATVSQLFCLIIAYVLGTAMAGERRNCNCNLIFQC